MIATNAKTLQILNEICRLLDDEYKLPDRNKDRIRGIFAALAAIHAVETGSSKSAINCYGWMASVLKGMEPGERVATWLLQFEMTQAPVVRTN